MAICRGEIAAIQFRIAIPLIRRNIEFNINGLLGWLCTWFERAMFGHRITLNLSRIPPD
jgi:hypothetical protein